MLELREVNQDNFDDVIGLSVNEGQRNFVATNLYSLAQSKVYPEFRPTAIYNDDTLVGFVMYGWDTDDNEYWIHRLMIDKKYQGLGFGSAALKCVIEELQANQACKRIFLSFEPENVEAKRLYEKFGFTPDGRVLHGETVYCLQFVQ